MSVQFYLASQSPRRRELLEQIGAHFAVLNLEYTEPVWQAPQAAADYVQQMAAQKARLGWAIHRDLPCLGADTVVVYKEQVFGKPRDAADATRMLQQLSGSQHQVLTAITLCDAKRCLSQFISTQVEFCTVDLENIKHYWQSGEPQDKAGAYAIQGRGALFVKSITGSYSSIVGLPLFETAHLLRQFGVYS